MTRVTAAVMFVIVGVGFVVAVVRAQDRGMAEPRLFPMAAGDRAAPGALPSTPASARGAREERRAGEPTPASVIDSSTPPSEITGSAVAPVRRPSAAERLTQIREAPARAGLSSAPGGGRPVAGPVQANPVELSRNRASIEDSEGESSASREDAPLVSREGTTSVLKKAEPAAPASEHSTARRLQRPPVGSALPLSARRALESHSEVVEPVAARPPAGVADAPATATAQPRTRRDGAILTSSGPALQVETTGPASLVIGSEAVYTVAVHNEGTIPARHVQLRVGLPASVRAVAEGATAETGPSDMAQPQRFVWSIPQIPARSSERVTVRVVPTENKPIPLLVDWTTRPVAAEAQIEVLQPQLELAVFGPRDVQFGETAVYTLRLSNPGTGDAEDVAVEFGYGEQRLEPKRLGSLGAGKQMELKVELNAREAGTIEMLAAATAAGGLQVQARQEVLVRRAQLQVEVAGEAVAYAGSPVSYRIVVRNAGNAPASDVRAVVSLPPGAKLLQGEGLKAGPEGLVLHIGSLPAGGDRSLSVLCELTAAGENPVAARVSGAHDQEASHRFATRVEALADLKLTVNDPQGPVAVSKDCVYELHIVNRGSKAATRIHVLAQFSQGIEPVTATGAASQIVPGQVIFETIPRIEPGQELTLVVKARADSEGTKRFRAEVTSDDSDTQLVAQETTYFYRDTKSK